jgi:hypothetical protein
MDLPGLNLQLLSQKRPRLVVPTPLPGEEWRLLRALATQVQGREWTLEVHDAQWLSRVLRERLGVAVGGRTWHTLGIRRRLPLMGPRPVVSAKPGD